jgi:hypothetical protein
MANTLKFGNGQWATKVGSTLAYNDENGNFKPLPFNFTRSTGGTRVNKDGLIEVVTNNKPRIDYLNDSNGALLLEPQRTNLALSSEEINNTGFWQLTNSGTITANSTISPDGYQNADTLNAGAAFSQVQGTILGTSGVVYTVSIWVKRITGTGNVFLRAVENANTLIAVTSDWQRFTATVTSTTTTIRIGINLATSGDAVAVWGGQIEAGSYATSYIPTQGATAGVTRVAEVCNQTPPSGIIGQTEGTIFAHFKRNGNIVSRGGVVFLREDFLRGLSINYINNTLYAISRNDAATTTVVLKTPFDINETAKVAITYNGSVFSGFLNGVKIFTDSVFNPFDTIVTEIRVSYGANSGSDIEIAPNSMKDVRVYTTVLTDQECINLTTL